MLFYEDLEVLFYIPVTTVPTFKCFKGLPINFIVDNANVKKKKFYFSI